MRRAIFIFVGFLLISSSLFSQIKVEGQIKNRTGEPLPGVNVVVKGTATGAISDIDGNYAISSVPANGTLVFSFIGMTSQEVSVNSRTKIDVVMADDIQSLDEVVAIGYGMVRKRDLTGAVSSVKSDEIKMAPVVNVMEAMQGRVAGLDITRSSGRSGSEPEVLLRGNRSLTASSSPLYIIDGIPGSISTLNPNDIQSIEVLKDASSTAIYGSAGANGVIIVTTKQAEKGKVKVDVDAYYGVNSFPSYPRALQGDAWFNYLEAGYFRAYGKNSASRNELLTAYSLSPEQLNPYIDAGKWIDWVDETLQTGTQQNYNVSLRGGTDRTQGYFSMGLNSEKGIYKNDQTNTLTMRTGVTHILSDWAKAGVQTTLSWRDRDSRGSRINKTYGTIPLGDVYDADGNIKPEPIDGNSSVSLIADDVDGVYINNSKQIRVTANPFVEITPIKGLSFRSVLGTSLSASRTGVYENENSYMNLTGSGSQVKYASYATSLGYSYNWENILNYNFKVAQNHDFTLTGITSWSNSQSESSTATNDKFGYDEFLFYNLNAGSNPQTYSSYSQTKKMSYAVRVNYNFMGRYLVTLSNRWDGASQLYNKWDYFPAAALAWRISDESFMQSANSWLSNLKLRAGYGVTGNANIPAYVSTSEIATGSNLSLGSGKVPVYILKTSVGNTGLSWEKSYNTNIGVDMGLFNNRIDLSLELYDTDTRDVLYNRPLPSSSGAASGKTLYTMMSNIAHINNKGIELTVNTRNVVQKDFKWNSTLTFAFNKEQVKNIDLGSNVTVDELVALNLFLGHPKNTVYGYKKTGIWQTGEADEAALFGRKPGEVKIESPKVLKDTDGYYYLNTLNERVAITQEAPYLYSAKDRQVLGATSPDWTMGFQNSFYWKNFDLNIFMTMRWGHLINADLLGYFKYGKQVNIPENYDYWTPDNPTNDFPQPNIMGSTNDVALASLSIAEGSYMKIKNITLGYSIPRNFGKKIGIEKLRFYGTIHNPFIFAKSHLLKNIDPETGGSDSFPLYKQIVFGVNLSF